MADIHHEAIKSVPCFDKDLLSVGACVHIIEIDPQSEQNWEIFGLIKNVELDQLVVIYFDSDKKSIDSMKYKKISIDSVVDKTCSIEILEPLNKEARDQSLHRENHHNDKTLRKISFPQLSF